MQLVLVSLAGSLAALFLWGVVSPRSQWYALVGWTRASPRETEPGSGAYAVGRVLSLIGFTALLVIGVNFALGTIKFAPGGPTRSPSVAEVVWGQPRPYVVDRVFAPLGAPPEGLVQQAVTGYQNVDGIANTPAYLFSTGKIRTAGLATQPGFIGVEPLPNAVALDTADLVVHVLGDDRCIPQQVTIIPVEGAVQVGVFFGQPNPTDGSNAANVADCDPDPPVARSRAYLIPVDLDQPLGERMLQSLDGTEIPDVRVPGGG